MRIRPTLGLLMLPAFLHAAPLETLLPHFEPLPPRTQQVSLLRMNVEDWLSHALPNQSALRAAGWLRDFTSPAAYTAAAETPRAALAAAIGVVDARVPFTALDLIATTESAALLCEFTHYTVQRV